MSDTAVAVEPSIDQLAEAYIKLRDGVKMIEDETKARIAPLKERMNQIAAYMLQKSIETGVDSFRTEHGTVFKKKTERINVENFEAFLPWAMDNGFAHMLKKDIASKQVKEWMEENQGQVPPGLKYEAVFEMQFRAN